MSYVKALLKNDKPFEKTNKNSKPEIKNEFKTDAIFICLTCGNRVANEFEEFMCPECEIDYDNGVSTCNICGKKFETEKMTYAYSTPELKKQVLVCGTCYDCEACSGCGYLAGASPCRWCQHDM